MPKIKYRDINFQTKTLLLIDKCNDIINDYALQGYILTLRQLYYQLVSRDIIANNVKEYNKLGNSVSDARLAGLIDWDAIEDRGRNLKGVGHWTDPDSIVSSCAFSFRLDKWLEQPYRPEVWIEKEALAGVFQRICNSLDVPYISCKGYMSQSEMWGASQRYLKYIKAGKRVKVFHFGDHDPSGIDMTRDIEDRLREFLGRHTNKTNMFSIERIALNMDQVEQYNPPENPAKSTDTRFQAYQEQFGDSSWELDALEPTVLADLVRSNILEIRNPDIWDMDLRTEASHRATLQVLSDNFEEVEKFARNKWQKDLDGAFEKHYQPNVEESEDEE